MQIPSWMITDEMKQTEHYRMKPSAPRSPNPDKEVAESSAPRRSTVIHLCIPERRSTRLTPPTPVLTMDKADEMILQDTLQHLASEEIEKMVDGQENIFDDSSIPRNDEPNIPGTMIEPKSNKESPEVEITKDKEVEITNVVIPVNVNDDDEEITDEKLQELTDTSHTTSLSISPHKERQKAKEETERLIAKAILQEHGNIQAQILTQIENAIANVISSQVDASVRSYMSGHILHVHPAQSQTSSVPNEQY
ncbi:hypothetical protein Tco_1329665 [Tanacetum coccineum]